MALHVNSRCVSFFFFCEDGDETRDHIFFYCPGDLMCDLGDGLGQHLDESIIYEMDGRMAYGSPARRGNRIDAVIYKFCYIFTCYIYIYCIWPERNLMVFKAERKLNCVIKDQVMSLVRYKIVMIPKLGQKMGASTFGTFPLSWGTSVNLT